MINMTDLYKYQGIGLVDKDFIEEQHYIRLFAKYLEDNKESDSSIFIKKLDFLADHKLDKTDRIYKFFMDER